VLLLLFLDLLMFSVLPRQWLSRLADVAVSSAIVCVMNLEYRDWDVGLLVGIVLFVANPRQFSYTSPPSKYGALLAAHAVFTCFCIIVSATFHMLLPRPVRRRRSFIAAPLARLLLAAVTKGFVNAWNVLVHIDAAVVVMALFWAVCFLCDWILGRWLPRVEYVLLSVLGLLLSLFRKRKPSLVQTLMVPLAALGICVVFFRSRPRREHVIVATISAHFVSSFLVVIGAEKRLHIHAAAVLLCALDLWLREFKSKWWFATFALVVYATALLLSIVLEAFSPQTARVGAKPRQHSSNINNKAAATNEHASQQSTSPQSKTQRKRNRR